MKSYTQASNSVVSLAVIFAAASLLSAGRTQAAQAGITINTLPPETVTLSGGGAVVDDNGEYLTVAFRGRGLTPGGANAGVRTTLETAQGRFTGDYLAAGVQGLAFDLKHTGLRPPIAEVVLTAGDGTRWLNHAVVSYSDTENTWHGNNISFDLRAGWKMDTGRRDAGAWEAALRNVASIGLNLSQVGTVAQTASVDNFRLLLDNEVVTPEAVLTEVLYARFGVNSVSELTAAQRALDSDGNGIADWKEIMFTESNPDDALDGLLVKVRRTVEGANEVSWPARAGRQYRVLVSDSPAGPFNPLPGAEAVNASVRGRMARTDTTEGPRFYRVVQVK